LSDRGNRLPGAFGKPTKANYSNTKTNMNKIGSFLHVLLSVATGIVGYTIHQSLWWAIVNGVFYSIA
jgi:hypothetical protein